MDHYDSMGNGVGGGEVLDLFNGTGKYDFSYQTMDNSLIKLQAYLPILLIIIGLLLLGLLIICVLRIYGIKHVKKSKGITNELEYINKVRKNDELIIRRNKAIQRITKIIEKSLFKSNPVNKEYNDYNLERAGIKIPGKTRYMKSEEFNAIVVMASGAVCAVALLIAIFLNVTLGLIMVLTTIFLASTMPMMYVRSLVKVKDDEIKDNFSDYYLMIHYVLLSGTKTPLVGIMKSYAKTTDSNEMKRMVDTCVHYIDTYGEYEGARYISKAYREIPVMGKLMRLIRQANEGGEIQQELMGFRKELLDAKRYAIERRTDKLIKRARASFYILMPILLQAILSAMSIYLSDLGVIKTFTTGI